MPVRSWALGGSRPTNTSTTIRPWATSGGSWEDPQPPAPIESGGGLLQPVLDYGELMLMPFTEFGSGLKKGIWSSLTSGNLSTLGGAAEALEVLRGEAPEATRGRAVQDRVGEWAAEHAEGPTQWGDIDFGTDDSNNVIETIVKAVSGGTGYIGGLMGSGLGSMAAPVAAGAAGAAVGGPVGAVGGALSVGAMLNIGETYRQLRDEGIDPKQAAQWAIPVGTGIGAIDTLGLSRLLGATVAKEVKQNAISAFVKQGAKGFARGASEEGLTEMGQSAIREGLAATLTGDLDLLRRAGSLLEEGLAGGLAGGALGGAGRGARAVMSARRPTLGERRADAAPERPDLMTGTELDPMVQDGAKAIERVLGDEESNGLLTADGLPAIGTEVVYRTADGEQKGLLTGLIPEEDGLPAQFVLEDADGIDRAIDLPLPDGSTLLPTEAAQREHDRDDFAKQVGKLVPGADEQTVLRDLMDETGASTLTGVPEDSRKDFLSDLKDRVDEQQKAAEEQRKADEEARKAAEQAEQERQKAAEQEQADREKTALFDEDVSDIRDDFPGGGFAAADTSAREKMGLPTAAPVPVAKHSTYLSFVRRAQARARKAEAAAATGAGGSSPGGEGVSTGQRDDVVSAPATTASAVVPELSTPVPVAAAADREALDAELRTKLVQAKGQAISIDLRKNEDGNFDLIQDGENRGTIIEQRQGKWGLKVGGGLSVIERMPDENALKAFVVDSLTVKPESDEARNARIASARRSARRYSVVEVGGGWYVVDHDGKRLVFEMTEDAAERTADSMNKSSARESVAPESLIAGPEGRESTLRLESGADEPVRYRVVEADSLIPSHDPFTFGKDARYPGGIQERTYDRDKTAQKQVIDHANDLQPDRIIDTSSLPASGPPQITPSGVVLGGNSRAMSLKRAYQEGGAEGYRSELARRAAAEFGIDPAQLEGMQRPVLVREVTGSPTDAEGLRKLGRDMNADPQKAMSESALAVSAGRNLSESSVRKVADQVDMDGGAASLRDLMRDHPQMFRDILLKDGVIAEKDMPEYFTDGALNDAGKDFIEKVMVGSFVGDVDLMSALPKSVIQKLERIVPPMTELKVRSDAWNITDDVLSATRLVTEAQNRGLTLDDLFAQQDMFSGAREKPADSVMAIARLLSDAKQVTVGQAFKEFAKEARLDSEGQTTMFGAPDPRETFERVFEAITIVAAKKGVYAVKRGVVVVGEISKGKGGRWSVAGAGLRNIEPQKSLDGVKRAVISRLGAEQKQPTTAPEPDPTPALAPESSQGGESAPLDDRIMPVRRAGGEQRFMFDGRQFDTREEAAEAARARDAEKQPAVFGDDPADTDSVLDDEDAAEIEARRQRRKAAMKKVAAEQPEPEPATKDDPPPDPHKAERNRLRGELDDIETELDELRAEVDVAELGREREIAERIEELETDQIARYEDLAELPPEPRGVAASKYPGLVRPRWRRGKAVAPRPEDSPWFHVSTATSPFTRFDPDKVGSAGEGQLWEGWGFYLSEGRPVQTDKVTRYEVWLNDEVADSYDGSTGDLWDAQSAIEDELNRLHMTDQDGVRGERYWNRESPTPEMMADLLRRSAYESFGELPSGARGVVDALEDGVQLFEVETSEQRPTTLRGEYVHGQETILDLRAPVRDQSDVVRAAAEHYGVDQNEPGAAIYAAAGNMPHYKDGGQIFEDGDVEKLRAASDAMVERGIFAARVGVDPGHTVVVYDPDAIRLVPADAAPVPALVREQRRAGEVDVKDAAGRWRQITWSEYSALRKRVEEAAERIVPEGVRVNLQSTSGMDIGGGRAKGLYYSNQTLQDPRMEIALASSDPEGTLRHETIHALRDMGVLQPKEWKSLTRAALKGGWIKKHDIASNYEDAATHVEEAIAHEYESWWRAREGATKPTGVVARLFERIRQLLGAVREALGVPTGEQVFRRIETGAVARRGQQVQGRGQQVQPAASIDPSSEPVRKSDIISELSTALGDIPIRVGRLSEVGAVGEYKAKPEVVRTRRANDIPVAAEEIGRHINKLMFGGKDSRINWEPLAKYSGELTAGDQTVADGFAEFVRDFIVDPAAAKERAPKFWATFNRRLAKLPGAKRALIEAQASVRRYVEQPEASKVFSAIRQTAARKAGWSFDGFYTAAVDRLRPIEKVVESLSAQSGKKPDTADDAYQVARLAAGWMGKADQIIENGTFDFLTLEKNGKGLKEILQPLIDAGKRDDFTTYLVAHRALELDARGIDSGIDPKVAKAALKQVQSMAMHRAARDLYGFQDRMLQYRVQAGLLSQESYDRITAQNKRYVPFRRVMDDGSVKGGAGQSLVNLSSKVMRIKGSARDIVDPLESILADTMEAVNIADRNRVGQVLAAQADATEGGGKWVEKVPPKMAPTGVTVKAVDGALQDLGLDTSKLSDEEKSTVLSVFRPDLSPSPGENVVSVLKDGQRELYQVHPDVHRALTAQDAEAANIFIKFASKIARVKRAGATAVNPEFIGVNIVRDAVTGFIQSRNRFVPFLDTARGLFSAIKRDDLFQEWEKAGGAQAALVSMDRATIQKNIDDMFASPGKWAITHPIDALRIFGEMSEAATRLGEFRKARKRGKSAREAALDAREVTLDFSRMGTAIKGINSVVAFYNAGIQGTDKYIRSMRSDPVGTTLRSVAGVTVPSLIFYALNQGNEDYDEAPRWLKDMFWLVPTKGTPLEGETPFVRIPKPHLPGVLFGTAQERTLDWVMKKDPKALDGFYESLENATLPGQRIIPEAPLPLPIPDAATPFIEWFANRSIFRGRDIVPQGLQNLPAQEQYQPWTSEFAKQFSRMLGRAGIDAAPLQIENTMFSVTAGTGRILAKLSDPVLRSGDEPSRPAGGLAEVPIVRAFAVRPGGQSESEHRLYDRLGELDRKRNAIRYAQRHNRPMPDEMTAAETRERTRLNAARNRLSNLTTLTRRVESSDMDPEAKRERLLELAHRRTSIARAVMQALGG